MIKSKKKMSFITLSRSELGYIKERLDAAGGTLNHDEFKDTIRAVTEQRGLHIPDRDISILFMQIDVNAGGTVDWEELTSFFLLTSTIDTVATIEGDTESSIVFKPLELTHRSFHTISRCVRHTAAPHRMVSVSLSRRKGLLLTASPDGMAKAWNIQDHHIHHERTFYVGRENGILDLQLFPNNIVAVANRDRTIYMYDARKSFEQVRSFIMQPSHHPNTARVSNVVPFVTCNRGDRKDQLGSVRLVASYLTHMVRAQTIPLTVLVTNDLVYPTCIAFIKQSLVIGTNTGELLLYEMADSFTTTLQPILLVKHHTGPVRVLIELEAIECVVTGSDDGVIMVLNRSDFQVLQKLVAHNNRPITRIVWSPEFLIMCSISNDGVIYVWDPPKRQPLWSLTVKVLRPVIDVCFIIRSPFFATLREDGITHVWDMRKRCLIATVRSEKNFVPSCLLFADRFRQLIFATSKGFHRISALTGKSGSQSIESVQKRGKEERIPGIVRAAHSRSVNMLLLGEEKRVVVFDLCTKREKSIIDVEGLVDLRLDASDQRLIVGTANGGVALYNYIANQVTQTCESGDTSEVSSVLFCIQELQVKGTVQELVVAAQQLRVLVYVLSDSDTLKPHRVYNVAQLRGVMCMALFPPAMLFVGGETGICLMRLDENSTHVAFFPTLRGTGSIMRSFFPGKVQGQLSSTTKLVQLVEAAREKVLDDTIPEEAKTPTCEVLLVVPRTKSLLLIGRGDGVLMAFDARQGCYTSEIIVTLGDHEALFSLALDERQQRLFCGDSLGYVHLFDISLVTGAETLDSMVRLSLHRGHLGAVTQVLFLLGELCSCGNDGRVNFWTEEGELAHTMSVSQTVDVSADIRHAKEAYGTFDMLRSEWLLAVAPTGVDLSVLAAESLPFLADDTYPDADCVACLQRLLLTLTVPIKKYSLGLFGTDYLGSNFSEAEDVSSGHHPFAIPQFHPFEAPLKQQSLFETTLRENLPIPITRSVSHRHRVGIDSEILAPRPLTNNQRIGSFDIDTVIGRFEEAPEPDIEHFQPQGHFPKGLIPQPGDLLGTRRVGAADYVEAQRRSRQRYTRTHLLQSVRYFKVPAVPKTPLVKRLEELESCRDTEAPSTFESTPRLVQLDNAGGTHWKLDTLQPEPPQTARKVNRETDDLRSSSPGSSRISHFWESQPTPRPPKKKLSPTNISPHQARTFKPRDTTTSTPQKGIVYPASPRLVLPLENQGVVDARDGDAKTCSRPSAVMAIAVERIIRRMDKDVKYKGSTIRPFSQLRIHDDYGKVAGESAMGGKRLMRSGGVPSRDERRKR